MSAIPGDTHHFRDEAEREGYKYFDLRDWHRVKAEQGLTDDEMFAVYVLPFLDESIAIGQIVRFADDPVGDPGFLGREFEYLLDAGYTYSSREKVAYPPAARVEGSS